MKVFGVVCGLTMLAMAGGCDRGKSKIDFATYDTRLKAAEQLDAKQREALAAVTQGAPNAKGPCPQAPGGGPREIQLGRGADPEQQAQVNQAARAYSHSQREGWAQLLPAGEPVPEGARLGAYRENLRRLRDAVEDTPRDKDRHGRLEKKLGDPAAWKPEMTAFVGDRVDADVLGEDTFAAGGAVGHAVLWDFAAGKIVCAGTFAASNSTSLLVSKSRDNAAVGKAQTSVQLGLDLDQETTDAALQGLKAVR